MSNSEDHWSISQIKSYLESNDQVDEGFLYDKLSNLCWECEGSDQLLEVLLSKVVEKMKFISLLRNKGCMTPNMSLGLAKAYTENGGELDEQFYSDVSNSSEAAIYILEKYGPRMDIQFFKNIIFMLTFSYRNFPDFTEEKARDNKNFERVLEFLSFYDGKLTLEMVEFLTDRYLNVPHIVSFLRKNNCKIDVEKPQPWILKFLSKYIAPFYNEKIFGNFCTSMLSKPCVLSEHNEQFKQELSRVFTLWPELKIASNEGPDYYKIVTEKISISDKCKDNLRMFLDSIKNE